MKTSELIGPTLDWAVSKITNPEWTSDDRWHNTVGYIDNGDPDDEPYEPSTNWAQGGPLIESERISIEFNRAEFKDAWIAYKLGIPDEDNPQGGPTPLIAAMRAVVASRLGDEIEIPEELK